MLQREFVLAHLAEDGADVEVDVTGVAHLEAVLNRLLAEVQVVVLNFECLLKVAERRSQLLGSSEYACKVVVCYRPVTVPLLGQRDCLVQQLKRNVEVLCQSNVSNLTYPSGGSSWRGCYR